MAISYPLSQPTATGFEQITLRAREATAMSESPFSYKQQVFAHQGARWEAEVILPRSRKEDMDKWISNIVSMRGQVGTMLIGDPDHASPRGSVSALSITGSAGDTTVGATITGQIKKGDHFQLGTGGDAQLYMSLEVQDFSGNLEIWPPLRTDQSSASATLTNPKGVFRLKNNVTEWTVDNASFYDMKISFIEDLT